MWRRGWRPQPGDEHHDIREHLSLTADGGRQVFGAVAKAETDIDGEALKRSAEPPTVS
jgi:hypothetical protein